jgi:hypothetical protein
MPATKKQVKDMADRLISTLDTLMPAEKADAIVRDVATELYRDLLDIDGEIVVDRSQSTGHVTGNFGKGKRHLPIAKFKFEPKEYKHNGIL